MDENIRSQFGELLPGKKVEEIDGIWVATEMEMKTKKGKKTLHKTVLHAENVRFNQDIDDDFFSVRQLEKGP